MRAQHLLGATVAVCLLLLLREQPVISPPPVPSPNEAANRERTYRAQPALPRFLPPAAVTLDTASDAAQLLLVLRSGGTGGNNGTAWQSVSRSAPADKKYFMALGVVSNVMWQNSFDRRRWIRETWLTYPNVGKTTDVKFVVAMRRSDLSSIPAQMADELATEQQQHRDLLMLEKVPERKSPCLKTMAWYRWAVGHYADVTFIAKTDDDAYVHTPKLELNMRPFASEPLIYIGSTLWGTYIKETFEPCARRMGPMMAVGGMKEERCVERGADGPYPYAVGMLQVLSLKVASWMVEQEEFAEFERRATAATRPPMMDQGEDLVIGMFIYHSPWPLMPLHWGWDKLHDLCFKCERKDQIWRPITHQTVVAHHTANSDIMHDVHRNITRACEAHDCAQPLPMEVKSLADLCGRGSIKKVYSKCKMLEK
jgi:hypothetical protein